MTNPAQEGHDAHFLSGVTLPRWLTRLLNYRLAGKAGRERRKQFTANILGLFAVVTWVTYPVGYLAYDPGFWPAALVCLLMLVVSLYIPRVVGAGNQFGSTVIGVLHCGAFALLSFFFGSGSGVFLYNILLPLVLGIIMGPKSLLVSLLNSIVAAASIFVSLKYFAEPQLEVAKSPTFQNAMLASSSLWPVLFMGAVFFVLLSRANRAEDALEAEHARSEALLYNLLPEEIAARLKVEPDKTIADSLPQVAILFADIVDFTPRSARMAPEEIVGFLNSLFSAFDELAEKHGLEKIKTIGDAYMVAAGMPNPCGDPVHRVAEMALDMLEVTAALPDGVEVRIGLHAGPAVAGVIGNRKLFYDVWCETVNTASRMESHGEPSRIQVTEAARAELAGAYGFEPRGSVEVKGMGEVQTWWLSGRA